MMFAAALGLLAAIFAAAAVALAGRFYKHRTKTIARARAELDTFYHAAQKLLKDDTLPEGIARFVEVFAEEAMKPRLALRIGGRILSGRVPKATPSGKKFVEEVDRLTAEQQETLADCVAFGLLVSAASNLFIGTRLRSLLIFGLFNGGKAASGNGAPEHVESPRKAIGIAANDFAREHRAELEACPA